MTILGAWAFIFGVLVLLAFEVGFVVYAVWRLGEGLRVILKMVPAIQLMEKLLASSSDSRKAAPPPVFPPNNDPRVYFPGDIGVTDRGAPAAPIMTEDEIKELLEQQRRGQ